ncbi:phospholipid-binding lipoprotein MlaA [Sphingomonas zeicaulis]|uniref:MlaA family lipoprotein n=1 Tax=Sphingomonas zeicaulis TaxID=1632740 RepID=UPI003D21035E
MTVSALSLLVASTAMPMPQAAALPEPIIYQQQAPAPAPPPGTGVTDPPAQPTTTAPPPSDTAGAPPPPDGDDIVVTGESGPPPGDPMEKINEKSFEAVQAVDKAVVGPMANTYKEAVPSPVRKGLRNFLSNLGEPVNALNFLLQLKPGKAAETVGRFAINTTVGVAGIVDVAKKKPFNLPRRTNGFANTMGYYGIGPGPYFYLPLVGPTTLRDALGDGLDRLVLPLAVGNPFNNPAYVIPAKVIDSLDQRAEYDAEVKKIRAQTNPYAAVRNVYLCRREAEIEALHGREPERCEIDPAASDEDEAPPPAAEPPAAIPPGGAAPEAD